MPEAQTPRCIRLCRAGLSRPASHEPWEAPDARHGPTPAHDGTQGRPRASELRTFTPTDGPAVAAKGKP